MTIKIKGIARGLKYISQIFAGKEQEMEIGYPTDVKHVAHIGLDGPSGNGPSWMKEFNTASNFSATSIGNSVTTFSSQAELERMEGQPTSEGIKDVSPADIPTIPKKQKRKKIKSTSCQESSSSSRSLRSARSKAKLADNTKNVDIA